MVGFLAYIMPVSGGPVDPGFGVPGWPAHPIAPGGQPPGIWGGAPIPWPTPPIYYPPVNPPGIWGGGNVPMPTPPIYLPPGKPPGIWGGPPLYPDIGGPGPQPSPGWPPVVMPPIYYPPGGGGGSPPGIWGPTDPRPSHPIVIPIPPGEKPPEPGNGLSPSHPIYIPGESGPGGVKQLVFVYVPGIGGVWFLIDVPQVGAVPPHPSHPIAEQPPAGGPKKPM